MLSWPSSIPTITDGVSLAGLKGLRIRCSDVASPEQLPRFLLNGERDDASFRKLDGGFGIDYIWPEVLSSPALTLEWQRGHARLLPFSRMKPTETSGTGETLGEALRYYHQWLSAMGSVEMFDECEREVEDRLESLGIDVQRPRSGMARVASAPAGLLRTLLFLAPEDLHDAFAQIETTFRDSPGSYKVEEWPPHQQYGEFAVRSLPPPFDESVAFTYVGPVRAAYEVANLAHSTLGARFAELNMSQLVMPQRCVAPLRLTMPGGGSSDLPALLPPQIGIGNGTGFFPRPLGRVWDELHSRGAARGVKEAQSRFASTFPMDRGLIFAMPTTDAPVISLTRVGADGLGTSVLCCAPVADDPLAACGGVFHDVYEAAGSVIPLCHFIDGSGHPFAVWPNLPHLNGCWDEEGFFLALPAAVDVLERNGMIWWVEKLAVSAHGNGGEYSSHPLAGPRHEGWHLPRLS